MRLTLTHLLGLSLFLLEGFAYGFGFLPHQTELLFEARVGFGTYPRACYTPRLNLFCRGEWNGTFTVPADGDYSVTLLTYGRTTASATVDGVPIPPQGLPLKAGEHTLHAEATMPRDYDAGVRVSLRRGDVEEVIPFWR